MNRNISVSNDMAEGSSSDTYTEVRASSTCLQSQRSFKDIISRFSDRTSCLGPGYIGSSRTWYARVIWICLFLGAMAGTTYMIYLNVDEFLSYRTRVGLYMGFSPLKFPLVSICNTNPVRKSQINNVWSKDLREFLNNLNSGSSGSNDTDGYMWSDLFWNASDSEYYYYDYYDYYDYGWEEDKPAKKDPRHQVLEQFKQLYGNEDSDNKAAIGHQLENMLISCSFGGTQCGIEHFTVSQSTEFGNCYSFNAESNTNLTARRSGNSNGLQLILNLENNEYIDGLTSGYGARLVVTEPGAMSLPEYNGVFLSAGIETDVGLKLINITRLDAPYSDCANQNDAKDFAEFRDQFRYTRQACQATCVHVKIMEECQCYVASQLHLYPYTIWDKNMDPCGRNESSCVQHLVASNSYHENLTCSCPNPCWEQSYDAKISSRDWPTNNYVNALHEMICKEPDQSNQCDSLDLAESMSDKRRNFLKVNVFYRDMNYENIIEEPDYPDSKFFSDLGGSAGFFLGLSVLTLLEVLELIMEICEWGLEKLFGQDPRKFHGRVSDSQSQNRPDVNSSVAMEIQALDKVGGYCEPVRYYSGKKT